MPEINWNALYGFWLVAEHGSFASAAKVLPRGSIQALHKRVRQLEQEGKLDLRLLKSRGVKGIELTEAGRRLHDFVDPVFKSVDLVISELRGEDSGPLAVAMSWYAIANYAEEILEDFHRMFPAVSIRLFSREPAEAIPLLERGQVDVIISSPWVDSRRLVVKAAAPIPFEFIALPRFRLRKSLTWAAVLEHPFVLTDRNSAIRQALEELLSKEKLLSQFPDFGRGRDARLGDRRGARRIGHRARAGRAGIDEKISRLMEAAAAPWSPASGYSGHVPA